MFTSKEVARFWDGVRRDGPIPPHCPEIEECWEWIKSRQTFGYGTLTIGGKSAKAHRVSWEIAFGPIPPGKHVLHRCDNPPCVRPSHLFVGSNAENTRDRAAKGRSFHPVGSLSAKSKLTEPQVARIKERYVSEGATLAELAHDYGVSTSLIGQIVRGLIWQHIGGNVSRGYASGERTNKNTITEAQVREIRERRAAGEKLRVLAAAYGCSEATISLVARGKIWRSVG